MLTVYDVELYARAPAHSSLNVMASISQFALLLSVLQYLYSACPLTFYWLK